MIFVHTKRFEKRILLPMKPFLLPLLWAILRQNTDPSSPIIKSEKTYTLKTPVFEIASVLKNIRVEIFVLHNGKFCIENFS
jgi:hypothetical protein